MTTRIGINGFGRIGRQTLKAILERHPDALDVVALNDLAPTATNAHLFTYDSTYGRFQGEVTAGEGTITVNGHEIRAFSEKDPAALPWKDLGVDIVVESTGIFTDATKAAAHRDAGARKVIISAPAKNEDVTLVLGVNEDRYDPERHHIVSNASCTTNGLALPAKVIFDTFGIEHGLMTTIHSYTNDQNVLDVFHPDLRRARSAGQNIIPTSTGAARALALVIPELKGKFDGFSLRVPTPTVSVIDFVAITEKPVSAESANAALRAAADGPMKGLLGYTDEELVSMDFKGDDRSSIIDAASTMVTGDRMLKVIAWYDNEWGYSCRVADLAAFMAQRL
ncbi:MAG: type I glyceraldehyde-3-phosphate dehydrogenase [Chloroflexi bacterium]|nr:type I glyceraldehyde-3-phosphate dehydrogenase [Chloroflexota bacterium]MBA3739860.1 type I glyceraldehyde-3-phosphate dehydrogenase [Chloroflexota bacterium]